MQHQVINSLPSDDTSKLGYSVTGPIIDVKSFGEPGDMFATPQACYDRVAVDDLLGEPSATNDVWVSYNGISTNRTKTAVTSVADATNSVCTISSTAHGLLVGDYIRLLDMSVSAYNGVYTVLSKTDNTFTIAMTYSATATGTCIGMFEVTADNPYVGVLVDEVSARNIQVVKTW